MDESDFGETIATCPWCSQTIRVSVSVAFNPVTSNGHYRWRNNHFCPEIKRMQDLLNDAVKSAVEEFVRR